MRATTEDGTELLTLSVALNLARHTPVPAWAPARDEWAAVDAPELRWTVCGTFGDTILSWRERRRALIGTHLSEEHAREIVEYCERFAREHPDTPCIPRTEVAYRRNSYTTTKTYLFTYNSLKACYNDNIREFTPRSYGSGEGANQREGAAQAPGKRGARNPQRQGAGRVEIPFRPEAHTLFDEEGG